MDRRTDRQMDERVLSWGWLGQDGGEGQSHTHLEEGWGLWVWAPPPNLCLPSMKNTLGKMRRLRWYLEDSPSFLKPVLHPSTSLSWKVTKPDSRVSGSIKAWSKGVVTGRGSNPGDHRNSSSWTQSSATGLSWKLKQKLIRKPHCIPNKFLKSIMK